jgi:glucose-1-phosphate adenylyltransferase
MLHATDLRSARRDVLVMILAGGQGERLYPLTKRRAKPSVRFGGAYRMIDFTLSNSVNSGLKRIYVLTQFASTSLSRHIRKGWSGLLADDLDEYIEVLPPQRVTSGRFYSGTADAIYQNLFVLQDERPEQVLLLSGDHAYKLDYADMLTNHIDTGAALTIACLEVPRESATTLGVAQCDETARIIGFEEKPDDPKPLPSNPDYALVSMGVYLWNTKTLVQEVASDATRDTQHDFGRNIVPAMVERNLPVYAYIFRDSETGKPAYWRDIGTLDSYWNANMDLANVVPEFDLYDNSWPVYTYRPQYPPAKTVHPNLTRVEDSLLCDGCIISGAALRRSILSYGVHAHRGADITESIIMDDANIGHDVRLHRVIVDEGVAIPDGYEIGVDLEQDRKRFVVTDSGLVVVSQGVVFD